MTEVQEIVQMTPEVPVNLVNKFKKFIDTFHNNCLSFSFNFFVFLKNE